MGSTTSGPEVLLFKQFKAQWESIDKTAYQVAFDDKHLCKHLPKDVTQHVTLFATSQLTNHQPRDEYSTEMRLILQLQMKKIKSFLKFTSILKR